VSAALMPGGVFMFDAIERNKGKPMTYRTWLAAREWAVLAEVTEDLRRHIVTRRITTFARVDARYRRALTMHRVAVYARDAVVRELRARGFVVRTLSTYGAAPLPPRRVLFLGRLSNRSGVVGRTRASRSALTA
jgi:hypothetical protein